jgi:hypothetical protein
MLAVYNLSDQPVSRASGWRKPILTAEDGSASSTTDLVKQALPYLPGPGTFRLLLLWSDNEVCIESVTVESLPSPLKITRTRRET